MSDVEVQREALEFVPLIVALLAAAAALLAIRIARADAHVDRGNRTTGSRERLGSARRDAAEDDPDMHDT